jgi:mannose-6-phosphate isomerase-like protein (cupin superfamily)
MTIEGVIYTPNRGIDHEDNRRALFTAFNGEFSARQVKFVDLHRDAVLGGHFHNYGELFYMLEGEGEFTLLDRDSGETETYKLERHGSLIIPSRIPHKALVSKGSILVGATEEPYISASHNDHKYDF